MSAARGEAKVIDGKAVSKRLLEKLPARVAALTEERGEAPLLAIVAIGADSPSEAYLKTKLQACRSIGLETSVHSLPRGTTEAEAFQVLDDLGGNLHVDAILLEMPVPEPLDARRLIDRIPPEKDAEGVTERNFGRLFAARSMADIDAAGVFLPCTALSIITLIQEAGIEPRGKQAVVIGRSNIVGKPAAHLLSCLDATVTLCHTKTPDLVSHLKRADIVVSAVGKPGLVTGAMLKRGTVLIDAGVCYEDGVMKGDADFESVRKVAAAVTPVPGGVGPVTTACLLLNTVLAAERRTRARLAA